MAYSSVQAQKASFSASSSQDEVAVGEAFQVFFLLKNASIKSFEAPPFKGLEPLGPPMTGKSFTYSNGQSVSTESYTYQLAATKEGKYSIGAATVVTADGQTFKSKPFKVKVVKGSGKSSTPNNPYANMYGGNANTNDVRAKIEDKVLLVLESNTDEVVVGEQVLVDLKICTQIGLEQANLLKEPRLENAYMKAVKVPQSKPKIETINGKQYTTQVTHRFALFPSEVGDFEIESAMIQVGVAVNSGYYGSMQVIGHMLASNTKNIKVRQLDGAPSGYSGAVGDYKFYAHVENTKITSDDVVELKVKIAGKGDIRQVLPPAIEVEEAYLEVYPPNIDEKEAAGKTAMGGEKLMTYIVAPKAIGDFKLKAKFVSYSPTQKRFIKQDTAIQWVIKKGNKTLPSAAELAKAMKDSSAQKASLSSIKFGAPQTETTLRKTSKPFWGTSIFWILAAAPFLGLGGVLVVNRTQKTRKQQKAVKQEKTAAEKAAYEHLKAARNLLKDTSSQHFYTTLSSALLGYIAKKLQIAPSALTQATIQRKLETLHIDRKLINDCLDVLTRCDMARFAGGVEGDRQALYQLAEQNIKQLESNFEHLQSAVG